MKHKQFKNKELTDDSWQLYEILNKESDLACVVIGAAFLDSVLENLLQLKFKQSRVAEKVLDSRQGGVLGDYQPRADVAYLLSLIEKREYQELCKIGEIRNLFAHNHLRLSFSEEPIKQLCSQLTLYRIVDPDDEVPADLSEENARMLARNRFNISLIILANRLLLTGFSLEKSV